MKYKEQMGAGGREEGGERVGSDRHRNSVKPDPSATRNKNKQAKKRT